MTPPRACVEAVRHWMVTWYGAGVSDQHGAELVEAVLAAFVVGEVKGSYAAVKLYEHSWTVTYNGALMDVRFNEAKARAVANVLNYLEAARG